VIHNNMRLVYADHIATPGTPRHISVHRRTLPQTSRGRKPWEAADITGKLPADALRATADRVMPQLAAYVRHAEQYGGLRDCWETTTDELDPFELGELAVQLRALADRTRRVGRKGRTVTIETFRLSRDETAALIAQLIDAGVGDVDVCRYTGAAQSMVVAIRRDRGSDPHKSAESEPVPRAIIRNESASPRDRPRSPAGAVRSPESRACEWCSAPLPSTLRAGARYCIGGRCKQAAHRARRRQLPASGPSRDSGRWSEYDGATQTSGAASR
jgi:hypothetical protein